MFSVVVVHQCGQNFVGLKVILPLFFLIIVLLQLSKILECPVEHGALSRSVDVLPDRLKIGLLSVPVGPIAVSRPKGFSLKVG